MCVIKMSLCSVSWTRHSFFIIVIAYIYIFLLTCVSTYNIEFLRRTDADWRQMWHSDCHRRCRSDLQEHIELACSVDIYRLYQRSGIQKRNNQYKTGEHLSGLIYDKNIERDKRTALSFLGFIGDKISKRQGIMQECCYNKPCTWEEYAETCHHYNRVPAVNANDCK